MHKDIIKLITGIRTKTNDQQEYGYRQFSAENYIMFVCVVPFGAGNCTVDHACHTVRLIKVFQ